MSTRATEAESVLKEHMGYLPVSEMERRGVSRTEISRFVREAKRKRQRAYMFHRMRSPIRCSNCSIDIRKPFFRMKLRCSCLERASP